MNLYRFNSSGRYLGFIVVDRPLERYSDRLGVDLCIDAPPDPPSGSWPFRVDGAWGGAWEIQLDPPRPAPPTPPVQP